MQSVILTQGCGCSVSRQLIHPSKKDVLVLSDHKLIMNCKISPIRTERFFFLPATPGGGSGAVGETAGGPLSLSSKLVIRPPKLRFQHLR